MTKQELQTMFKKKLVGKDWGPWAIKSYALEVANEAFPSLAGKMSITPYGSSNKAFNIVEGGACVLYVKVKTRKTNTWLGSNTYAVSGVEVVMCDNGIGLTTTEELLDEHAKYADERKAEKEAKVAEAAEIAALVASHFKCSEEEAWRKLREASAIHR